MVTQRKPWWRRIGWLGLSFVLHGLLFGILVFVPLWRNVRETLEQRRPEAGLSAQTLEAAARKLREINRADLQRRVAAVDDLAQRLAEIERHRAAQLTAYAADKAAAALVLARELAQRIVALQEPTLQDFAAPRAALQRQRGILATLLTEPGTEGLVHLNASLPDIKGAVAAQGKPLGALGARMDTALALHVQLADVLAWVAQPGLVVTQQQAQVAQQQAKDSTYTAIKRLGSVNQIAQWDLPGNLKRAVEVRDNQESWAVETRQRAAGTAGRLRDEVGTMADASAAAERALSESLAKAKSIAAALASATPGNPLPAADARASDAAAIDLDTLDIPALYEHALATERSLLQDFQSIRAAELTMVTDLAPALARETTSLATPPRPAIDARTFREGVATAADFAAHTAALRTALAETAAMISAATTMLETSRKRDVQEAQGIDLAQRHRENLAKARDNVGRPASAPTDGEPTAGDPATAVNWPYGGRRTGDAGFRLATSPAQGIAADGTPGVWFHLANWYTLGPFTAGQGVDIARRYAPEQIIDLDAVYKGPDGRALAWTYGKAPDPMVVFPKQADNAVYYATTELRLDTAGEYWLAIASDDRSELKVNGETVWIGEYFGDNERPLWPFPIGAKIGSRSCYYNHFGFRRVRFDAGVNRLFMRVENTGNGSAFSVLLATTDPRTVTRRGGDR